MIPSSTLPDLRLLLEELCCDLCRFEHTAEGVKPEDMQVDREVSVGPEGLFADIRIIPKGQAPYFVEVKYGYSDDAIIRSLNRKYGELGPVVGNGSRVVLVLEKEGRREWSDLLEKLERSVADGVKLEIWDEPRLQQLLRSHFGVEVGRMEPEELLDVRQAIDRAKGIHAFGIPADGPYEHDALRAQLLWHFGFWRLRQLRESRHACVREIVPPGLYRNVAVVIADLCSFSSFVRDTPSGEVMHQSLTSFYSKARYQIINNGGMHYQFVGDEVIGVFGLPDQAPGFIEAAYATAQSLCSIGRSVAHEWQRQIDRLQPSAGLHVGISVGDLHLLSLRPYSRTHLGFIGDSINIAARLMSHAGPDEIAVTNGFYQRLAEDSRADFSELEPIEAKNVGRIKAWRAFSRGTPATG